MGRRRLGVTRLIAGAALAAAVLGALAALMLAPTHADERGRQPATRQEPDVAPPAAVVLFDGTDTAEWCAADGGPVGWPIVDGALVVAAGHGDIRTVREFEDFRLHLEFWLPATPADAPEQDRANSGIYLQGRYELQVLDSFGRALADANDAGAIYGLKDADANATLPAETWQVYDVTFRAARWSGEAKVENARLTVLLNGVTIHDDVELRGPTAGGAPEAPTPGPILLQDHGNPVRYQDVWVEPLDETEAEAVLVEYRRTGGFMGTDDHLVVRTTGEGTLTTRGSRREVVLSEATLRELELALEQARFPELASEYRPPPGGADFFEHAVIYAGKTVRAQDTVVPDSLQPVLQILNQVMESSRP